MVWQSHVLALNMNVEWKPVYGLDWTTVCPPALLPLYPLIVPCAQEVPVPDLTVTLAASGSSATRARSSTSTPWACGNSLPPFPNSATSKSARTKPRPIPALTVSNSWSASRRQGTGSARSLWTRRRRVKV